MKSRTRKYRVLSLIASAILLSVSVFSCAKKVVTVNSITATLDEVDLYISTGQTGEAVKLLKKTDKPGLSPDIRLGIYKRYVTLGETEKAEKLLVSCLKKNPGNKKLIAVYSSLLLKKAKYKEALSYSKKLSGTQYGSLYAEALLRSETDSSKSSVSFEDYFVDDYVPVYFDAYSGSKDNSWLRNCAAIRLVHGDLVQALKYHPENFDNTEDAYFWATVSYDNKKFVEAVEDLQKAKAIANVEIIDSENFKDVKTRKQNLNLKIFALLSDAYINLSEEKFAAEERDNMISYISSLDEDAVYEEDEKESTNSLPKIDVMSVIYLNSALWALSKEDFSGAYNALKFEVEHYPDYVPGLIAYGNFAYNSTKNVLDDPVTLELRRLGLRSMDMEAYDNLPRVEVADALARMDDSLARFKNYQLYVARLDLEESVSSYHTDKNKLASIYQVVERNTLGTHLYPPEIARYAVHGIYLCDQKEEAENLFNKYLARRYKFDEKQDFYDEFFRKISKMETWEIEYTAWFATLNSKAKLAANIYEYIVFNEYLKNEKKIQEISPRATGAAMMNLAMIYSSTKRKDEAIKLYGKVASRAQRNEIKAESMYRIGVLYSEQDMKEEARQSLKYAVYLNPSHSMARLLLSKLK